MDPLRLVQKPAVQLATIPAARRAAKIALIFAASEAMAHLRREVRRSRPLMVDGDGPSDPPTDSTLVGYSTTNSPTMRWGCTVHSNR